MMWRVAAAGTRICSLQPFCGFRRTVGAKEEGKRDRRGTSHYLLSQLKFKDTIQNLSAHVHVAPTSDAAITCI